MESISMEAHNKMKKDELPLSLIESNILPRLPAKSVGRLMCVCKQWKSFLSRPMFARIHLHHVTINDHKLLLLLGLQPERVTFLTHDGSTTICYKPSPDPSAEYILASLDGLVCLASKKVSYKLAFWNPLTGAYKELSNSGYPFPSFNPSAASGLYKDSSNDYKLLYFGAGGWACIYSHRLDSWRKIDFLFGLNTIRDFQSQAIFCDRCFYFIVVDVSPLGRHTWIICFDVETENIRKKQCPPVPGGAKDYYRSLVVLNQCIHLCVSYTINIDHIQGDLWRVDGDVWVKVAAFPGAKHNKSRRPALSITTSNGNWIFVLEGKYCLKRMNTEDFKAHYWSFCSVSLVEKIRRTMYVETLVSPNP